MNEFENRIDLTSLHAAADKVKAELAKVLVGQEKMVEQLLVALLANGHVLIEGVPGVAKTLTAKLLAKTLDTGFSRIQFTPDLMPSDILGTTIFNQKDSSFQFKQGPIFSNIILIDEINRAPAKTQAALFEVMEERQITIDGTTRPLERPFIVIATQNPIEQEGTYRLPEAQLDRFLFKIEVEYPSLDEEFHILKGHHEHKAALFTSYIETVLTAAELNIHQDVVKNVVVEDNILRYIASLIQQTRSFNGIYLGASPRAAVAVLNSSKAFAAIQGHDFVTPDDVKSMAYPVLRHRIMLTPEKEMEGVKANDLIRSVIEKVEIPR